MLALPKYAVSTAGGRLTLHGWGNVAVKVQGDADPTVTEPLRDNLGVHTFT